MADITITIPNQQINRVLTAFSGSYSYPTGINGSPNPTGLAAFTKQQFINYVMETVVAWESSAEAEKARQRQINDTRTGVNIS